METTQNTTFAAFESFLKQDYKSCITYGPFSGSGLT